MQKKMIAILVLLSLLVIEPVIASQKVKDPKTKIAFTNRIVLIAGSSTPGEQVITETGILYVKDAISTGYIEADVDSPISGSVWTNLSGSVDLNTMRGSFSGEWTITTDKGIFEGFVAGDVAVTAVSGRFAGKGIGDLEGQEIKGSFEGTVNNYVIDLTLDGKFAYK